MYCCPLWFNSTSSSIKKLKASYNGVLRRLLLISEMFVTNIIPSFFELLCKWIYNFKKRIADGSNMAHYRGTCLLHIVSSTLQSDNGRDQ